MNTFAKNVHEVFETLRLKYKFVPARAASGKRFASLVRQITDDVFAYVFVHDGRPGHANLDVDLWVAPPETPDHSLERLYVGYKIRIGSEYEIDDSFFSGCEKRIIHFLHAIPAMVPLIRDELGNPGIRTERWMIYQIERRVLSWLLSNANAGDPLAISAVKESNRAVKSTSLIAVERACHPIATAILERGVLDADVLSFYEGNAECLATTIAAHLYVRALGSASVVTM